MRHAAVGNVLMLKTATSASQHTTHNSHTFAAQPVAVGMSPDRTPLLWLQRGGGPMARPAAHGAGRP